MRKFSMNSIFEDKTFIMFDRTDQTGLKFDTSGRAYFAEENTGRMCYIYRFADEVLGAQEMKGRKHLGVCAGIVLILIFIFKVADLYITHSYYTDIISNVLMFFGLTTVAVSFGVWVSKNGYKELSKDYQIALKEQNPIFIDENEKEDVLQRARVKKEKKVAVCAALLFLTIGIGLHFIMTSDMLSLVLSPTCAILLGWNGMTFANKMY